MGLQADVRAAAVEMLTDYAASTTPPLKLQVYPGRPRTVNPPTAFVDSIHESITHTGPTLIQRTPRAEVIVVHGIFDTKEAVDQKDAFCDGFVEWVKALPHASGANTVTGLVALNDVPVYVPEWLPTEQQRVYYATQITLEGYAEN